MKHMAIIGAGLMFASNATNAQQTDTRNEAILGVWSNPSGSVHVRIKECGTKLCGVVVYATEKAKSDAAQAGTAVLIGINLFREFDPGAWMYVRACRVQEPEMDASFKMTGPCCPGRCNRKGALNNTLPCDIGPFRCGAAPRLKFLAGPLHHGGSRDISEL